MLRTIRLTLAIVFFAIITLLFLDFSGTLHGYMGWMAKIQFLPALLALNVGVVLLLVVLTLLFRTRLLLRNLSLSVYFRMSFPGFCRQTEEKPFPLFPRTKMAALWNVGIVFRHPRCRRTFPCRRFAA